MDKPIIVLNLKTYVEGTGKNAVSIAQNSKDVAEETGIKIIVAPQIPDIYRVASSVAIPVFSQHVDGVVVLLDISWPRPSKKLVQQVRLLTILNGV
jgi:triosephosphate isomerase